MKWSSDINVCMASWKTLIVLDQINERQPFDSAEELKIGELRFFPQREGPGLLSTPTRPLALQIDKAFRLFMNTTYKPNIRQFDAVQALDTILNEEGKTVKDLAEAAENMYVFPQTI